jgi:hypothetical protein
MKHHKINKFSLSVPLLLTNCALHLSCESNQSQSKPQDYRSGSQKDAALNPNDPSAKSNDSTSKPIAPELTSSDLAGLDKTQ